MWFFAACLSVVAVYFMVLGAWLVLPFAGLELGVVVAGFYLSALSGHTREVILIKGPVLRVMRGRGRLDEIASFPANWTQVVLQRDRRGWYPSRLLLRCHGKVLEVGSKLVEAEREELALSLRDMLEFRISLSIRPDTEPSSERSALPSDARHRGRVDADLHARTSISLSSKEARVAGCAQGAYTKK